MTKPLTIMLEPETHTWLVEAAERAGAFRDAFAAELIEQARRRDEKRGTGSTQSPAYLNGYRDGQYDAAHGDRSLADDQLPQVNEDYAAGYRAGLAAETTGEQS